MAKIERKTTGTSLSETYTQTSPLLRVAETDPNGKASVRELNAEDLVVQQYMEFISQHGLTESDVADIQKSILETGNVCWSFDLFDRIPVELVLRKTWIDNEIIKAVDVATSEELRMSQLRFNNLVAEYNLAGSMTRYGDKTFEITDKKSLSDSLEFVHNLPYVIKNTLVNKLAAFERAVALAVSDWALKNFTTPRKESSEQSS